MPPAPSRVNRGPAAAAENRAAILAAARRLFTQRGFQVPLSVIAREAGTGQGVMYRHFGSRFDLAIAVFEDHFVDLERAVAEPGPDTFARLWDLLLEFTVEDAAFVEMMVEARRSAPDYDGDRRLVALVDVALAAAHRAGTVEEAVRTEHVLLAWRMCFGVVATAVAAPGVERAVPEPDEPNERARVRAAVAAARRLLGPPFG